MFLQAWGIYPKATDTTKILRKQGFNWYNPLWKSAGLISAEPNLLKWEDETLPTQYTFQWRCSWPQPSLPQLPVIFYGPIRGLILPRESIGSHEIPGTPLCMLQKFVQDSLAVLLTSNLYLHWNALCTLQKVHNFPLLGFQQLGPSSLSPKPLSGHATLKASFGPGEKVNPDIGLLNISYWTTWLTSTSTTLVVWCTQSSPYA